MDSRKVSGCPPAVALAVRIGSPILFRFPTGGKIAYGYEATVLAEICEAILRARDEGLLLKQQAHRILYNLHLYLQIMLKSQ